MGFGGVSVTLQSRGAGAELPRCRAISGVGVCGSVPWGQSSRRRRASSTSSGRWQRRDGPSDSCSSCKPSGKRRCERPGTQPRPPRSAPTVRLRLFVPQAPFVGKREEKDSPRRDTWWVLTWCCPSNILPWRTSNHLQLERCPDESARVLSITRHRTHSSYSININ